MKASVNAGRPTPIHPQIMATPIAALADTPVRVRLVGCAAGQEITLRAEARDDLGRRWASWASFQTDAQGAVDVAAQAPLSGSYGEADSTGLFWALAQDGDDQRDQEASPFTKTSLEPTTILLAAEVAREAVASVTVERWWIAPGVTRLPIRERGLVGTLFLPPGEGAHPGVLVLGGSSGGLREGQAALLASHGYVALALGYFAYESLPERLSSIPLEYFETALRWLRERAEVRGPKGRLAVLGASRGAELALLLGATFTQDVGAIVAFAPSAVIWGAVGMEAPAWTYHGVPLPYMRNCVTAEQDEELSRQEPIAAAPWYHINLDDAEARAAAAIPVERIDGPILLISGEDDQMWPAARLGDLVVERLTAQRYPYPYMHLRYPGAGHMAWPFSMPYLPATVLARRHPALGMSLAYGGNPRDVARAAADSWPRVLAFLAEWARG